MGRWEGDSHAAEMAETKERNKINECLKSLKNLAVKSTMSVNATN